MNALAGLLLTLGIALVIAGAAMISVPTALIIGGAVVAAAGVGFLETNR